MTITSYVLSAILVVLCCELGPRGPRGEKRAFFGPRRVLSRRRRDDLFQAFELFSKVPRHRCVDVGKERLTLRRRESLHVVDRGRDLRRELAAERVVARGR